MNNATRDNESNSEEQYKQELSRSLGVMGNVLITLSGVTPAVSIFAIAPVALTMAGSGSFFSFIFAAILGVAMALCWAELASKYPISGGDYALVWHAFKGKAKSLAAPISFITLALQIDMMAFIPAAIALAAGEYLESFIEVNDHILGAIIVILTTALAMLKIRFNTYLTGIFLVIELLALLSLTILGFMHAHNWRLLIHPEIGGAHGLLVPVAFSGVIALTSVAIFSYNGYSSSVNFSEETNNAHRNIARAILITLLITVIAELTPLVAVIVGAPNLLKLTTSTVPLEYFIKATSSITFYDIIAIGIAIAVVNATLAIILIYSRVLYSASRDRAFGLFSNMMSWVHPRYQTPWLSTAVVGITGTILCLTVPLDSLVNLTGASLVADYAIIALAAIVARWSGATKDAHYQMPFWPIPPILGLIASAYIFSTQTAYMLEVTVIIMVIGLLYWATFVLHQKGRVWNLRKPAAEKEQKL